MKNLFICLVLAGFISSCSSPLSETAKAVSGADSISINFNRVMTDSIEKVMNTTDAKAISELVHFISGEKKPAIKCPLDGNLLFYQKGTLLGDFSFSYSTDSCRQFILVEKDGSFSSIKMSDKAVDFLKSLAEGRPWY